MGTVSGKTNDWSYTLPSTVVTSRIRIIGVHATNATGQMSNPVVAEWEVYSCQ